ncbi:hypothetical protein EW145_g6346 [Phellinidium pouzarii]|uniref:Uncharacterized protein n=1 Tax=Phellinidium pouzarii TaxID=167371 RepID=A0A4V3XBU2_9AGAM|nr:hypothetical protein EW145_g6346 [Phellinidium pouzarii]
MTQCHDYYAIAQEGSFNAQSSHSSPSQGGSALIGQNQASSYGYPNLQQNDTSLLNSDHLPSYTLSYPNGTWYLQPTVSGSSSPRIDSSTLTAPFHSTAPYPQSDRFYANAPGPFSQSQTSTESPSPAIGNGTMSQTNNTHSYTLSTYVSSLTPRDDPGSSFTSNRQSLEEGPSDLDLQSYSSPSLQYMSQSISPQSVYSDLPEERPRQRRRTAMSTSSESVLSESEDASESSLSQVSSKVKSIWSSQRTRVTKASSSRKSRGKHPLRQNRLPKTNESSSFSTFMVAPSPAALEPSGATYISTVDFSTNSDASRQAFDHGPTDLPPRAYIGGPDATSPWKPRKNLGTIPGSALDYLPVVESRMARLERALDAYVQYRGEKAMQNSVLPGMGVEDSDFDDPMT